jgi:hypothetical protein
MNIMKKWMLLSGLIAAWIGMGSCSVTKSPAEIVHDAMLFQQAADAVDRGLFVLEGYELTFSRGGLTNVDENINFISVSPELVTIQTAFNNGRSGANGLGGITLEGRPDRPRVATDKRGNLTYSADVDGFISARIEIVLYNGTNEASATIYPTFRGGSITMRGNILPTEQARTIKGMVSP